MNLENYKISFLSYLKSEVQVKEPVNLYEPIDYILQLGGKRLRPILTLLSCDLFHGNLKDALPASLAIEVFHNFTLVHDDIMDAAPLRRGKETVHKKWDINTGILSGDAMLIQATIFLEEYKGKTYKKLMMLFNKMALEVCEGQQYDIDFETRNDVSIDQYIKMITFKTAVLIACALKMGAIIAKTSKKDTTHIYNFGLNLGIAFQLQDDYLDTFGDPKTFGKQIGGDILENKKTFMYLSLLKLASKDDKKDILKWFSITKPSAKKIEKITSLYIQYNIPKLIEKEINKYTNMAFESLNETSVSKKGKDFFKQLGNDLLNRKQ